MDCAIVRIEPTREVLCDAKRLCGFLEFYYLKGGHYELAFASQHLGVIEQAFDHLILTHGILASEFTFRMTGEDEAAV